MSPLPMRHRSITGIAVVLSMFVLGGVVFWGLKLAPPVSPSPPAPTNAVWGPPPRTVKFASYNILHNQRGVTQVIAELKKLDPDVLCLQEVESAEVVPMAEALDMQRNYHPHAYQKSVNLAGRKASWGNAILSKFPMYEADAIPNPGGGTFGVWAVIVVDGHKFLVANVHLSATWNANPVHIKQSGEFRYKEITNLIGAWQQRGSPPILTTGDLNQIPLGNNYYEMTHHWTDALDALGETGATFDGGLLQTRIDYFLLSKEWKPLSGGVIRTKASDHRPIWLEARAADPGTDTTTAP